MKIVEGTVTSGSYSPQLTRKESTNQGPITFSPHTKGIGANHRRRANHRRQTGTTATTVKGLNYKSLLEVIQ